jgi:hypothetical protein
VAFLPKWQGLSHSGPSSDRNPRQTLRVAALGPGNRIVSNGAPAPNIYQLLMINKLKQASSTPPWSIIDMIPALVHIASSAFNFFPQTDTRPVDNAVPWQPR